MNPTGSSISTSVLPVYTHQPSNCFYVLHPATGQPFWIVDYETGQPMISRPLLVDAATGCLCVASLSGAGYVWLVDPLTGNRIAPSPASAMQQSAPNQGQYASQTSGQQSNQLSISASGASSATTISQNQEYVEEFSLQDRQIQRQAVAAEREDHVADDNVVAQTKAGGKSRHLEVSGSGNDVPVERSTSGMAVAGLVLGIIAISTSFLPFINNGSFVLALIGLVFAIVGIVATGAKKAKKGRGMAIAALVLCVLTFILVLGTQSLFVSALDSATSRLEHGSTPVATTDAASLGSQDSAVEGEKEETAEDYSSMAIGESVTFDNGLTVSVSAVNPGLVNYDKSIVTGVVVTYANNGASSISFTPYDWKAQDANGVLRDEAYYSEADNELQYGELVPGGTVTGTVYFDGDIVKVFYYENALFQSDSSVGWVVG